MLVRFLSSETGEILMYADIAATLLLAMNKECTAQGTFTVDEMPAAAERLRQAVAHSVSPATEPAAAADKLLDWDALSEQEQAQPVALSRRAWPLLDMLERTAKGGKKANIVWQAAHDF